MSEGKERFLQNLWRWKCNMPEIINEKLDVNELTITEWSNEFEQLMRNRLIFGAFRYGKLKQDGKPQYKRMESIIKRAKKYNETFNQELLVDIANIALCEFMEPSNSKAHFKPIDDDGEHVNVVQK